MHPPTVPVAAARALPRWARPGLTALAVLAAIAFGAWAMLDRVVAGAGAEWLGYGLGGIAWYALGMLGFAWCVSRVSFPPLGWRAILALVLWYLPLAIAASVVVDLQLPEAVAAWSAVALAVFGVVMLGLALRRVGAPRLAPALAVATLFLAAFGALSSWSGISAGLWYAPDPESVDAADAPLDESEERLLYAQPARLEAALAKLEPRVAGRSNLFFLGFAGYGAQRVFAEEVRFAAEAVAKRYGTGTRTLTLVNDRRDLKTAPLATVIGLEQALQGIAQRMDLEDDVLFLVLSSHGAPDPLLSVQLGDLPLEQLSGQGLRVALDRAGIRWRVIVISACHAGAFLADLKDSQTIVLTAAATANTSFGCSDDRDLTYFGEAFFRDALPTAVTLRAAFETARSSIAARERRERVDTSDPQAWFGDAMDRRWRTFEPERSTRSDASNLE